VFAILLIAANTMMTSIRERTSEFGVLKTLGLRRRRRVPHGADRGRVITLGGGSLGALARQALLERRSVQPGGFLPPMSVYWARCAPASRSRS
jgi:hypothetical protein